ncbi:hypothetical protein LzC2_18000 [Planctomycetes bacterium LzC2]|uniref:EF-hand domain-containing protein n=1 Tax=Alienimonas chondri TaxID=2681879 RepID=A0ABX1VEL5_9PLAN|nr:hypothetical protein [Alienimonas chondri]
MDKNGDGKITRDETGDDRVKQFMRERGMEPNQTYSRDDWNQKAVEYEDKKATEAENEGEEERRNRRSGGDDGDNRQTRERSSGGPSYVRGGSKDGRGRPVRVTRDLPEAFGEFDVDKDGQIGLYEWRNWNRALLAEFLELDRDGDGYLTPRELGEADARDYARGESALPSLAASFTEPTQSDAPAMTGAARPAPSAAPSDEPVEISARDQAAAERYFKLLDADRSGRISLPEWDKSERLKPKFEAVGANLASELDLDAFVAAYAKTLAG